MNYKHIANGLKSLGLKKGDIVLLHSSFLSLGKVENGPTEVIKAFLSVIGKTGTLLVPVFGKLGVIPDEVKDIGIFIHFHEHLGFDPGGIVITGVIEI